MFYRASVPNFAQLVFIEAGYINFYPKIPYA